MQKKAPFQEALCLHLPLRHHQLPCYRFKELLFSAYHPESDTLKAFSADPIINLIYYDFFLPLQSQNGGFCPSGQSLNMGIRCDTGAVPAAVNPKELFFETSAPL